MKVVPEAERQATGLGGPAPGEPLRNARPKRALVVDDDPLVARTVAQRLARTGYAVTVARSWATASALSGSYAVGVLDMDLGDGSGLEIAEGLLAGGRIGHVLFYTAGAHQRELDRARQIGPVVTKREGLDALWRALACTVNG